MPLHGLMCLAILVIPIIAFVCILIFFRTHTRASRSSPLETLLLADDYDAQLGHIDQTRRVDRIKGSHGIGKVRGEYARDE